ncbi:MAG: hypothetical protein COT71_00050 [Candidatus Andersenbacteria bacterium CG10_big_fil_rev_8_21_14_0_10_54_11]|uniref:Glycosyl transferase family 1 domain-containing protein n=1 Tax=Candidatus Andersenbacteria bacterium CG10_big_fil_rev_8_21_14_0_10_54_11 TaxID=1974485 RepID=A0A2M6X0N5_9BACT|nr:MAG: hypothetical protein COT71_00050 [Candidatus Andersenbacteria bacterium CG10_big_fil_rev_8_21_14_0_10_54_11]
MNFAVIEYTSKTGGIWRHSAGHPNYLADPAREIDPTSFGCYVSAMRGEHIPLTLLLGTGNPLKRIYRKIYGRWPSLYSLEYLRQFDALLVVYELGNGPSLTNFVRRLQQVLPHIVILGVPTQPYGLIREYWHQYPQAKTDIKEFIQSVDAFITIVASTKEAWRSLSGRPVVYLPQPYPVAQASEYNQPRSAKQQSIFVAGVTSRDNILKGHDVAVRLQKMNPKYTIQVTDTPGHTLDTSRLTGARFEVLPFQPWLEHLRYLSRVTLTVNTDYTVTRGRVQVDCAAVGTPSIGADSDGQTDLFPHLPANRNTTVEELVRQSSRLLADTDWYDHNTLTAFQRLQKYDYEPSAERITQLIEKIRRQKS